MTPEEEALAEAAAAAIAENGQPPGEAWKRDKRGREYIRAQGRSGIIYRKGEQTPEEALRHDAEPKDQRPRRKSKTPHKPPPPAKADLRELEQILADAFQSPAMMCATFGDEWAANHFTLQGPYLARNMVVASQHNPWLRKKLETMATGGDSAMKLISMVGVGGALFGYAIPPLIYWFNMPVPDRARAMFSIPPRRDHDEQPPYAASPPPPPAEPASAPAPTAP